MQINQQNYNEFWEFVAERQNIWHKKEVLKLAPPWTKDEVLKKWKFTNVYRKNDKGTIFLQNEIINKYRLEPSSDMIFNIY